MIGKLNIYLLRHEEREDNDISYGSPLTDRGLLNAEKLIRPQLMLLNIDNIYCSPFIRSLQTIYPYCQKTSKKVNIEWALVESVPRIEEIAVNDFKDIINVEYQSTVSYDSKIRSFDDLYARLTKFINTLNTNENNLLVTHLPVINAIMLLQGDKRTNMFSFYDFGTLIYI